jgi:hypothetical protein
MTLGIIESGLFMGMIALTWVLLDVLGDAHHADDKGQGTASTE